jgi:tetratricopeptide (TPR) repeat protein
VVGVVESHPPTKTHPLEAPKIHKQLDAAREALRAGSYRTAYKQASEALETAITGDTLKTRCEEFIDQLEALARDRVARVDPLMEQKKFADAVKILRETARDFKGTASARTAARRLEALRGDFPEVAELLKGQEKESEARERLFGAQEQLRDQHVGEAYEEMDKISKEYPDTDAAAAAKRIMGRMDKHEAMAALIRDHMASRDCEAWLSQARSYIRSRRNLDKARQLLHDIIKKYPRTTYADQATEELSKLR